MGIVIIAAIVALLAVAALLLALVALRRASRPRPALPVNCGDCVYMVPRAKVYKRETLEDADGIVHYLCEQRWIEITPYSPRCELGKSKTRLTTVPN
ncbi:MAG TPA: hypothetical protein VL333_05295 [Candidatus Saccharimonadales bacterium]|jgi:hypothetical protein|nr:hypothetical protein [Candidatus Saccharimonadales bacterium]